MFALGGVKGIRDADQVCRVPGKLPCLGRGRQGRRPSLAGYQENFAGGRSRPEASESSKTRR